MTCPKDLDRRTFDRRATTRTGPDRRTPPAWWDRVGYTPTPEGTTMQLPDALKHLDKALVNALTNTPDLGEWPEGEKYRDNEQAQAIAGVLLPEFHDEVQGQRFRFLFKETLPGDKWAVASLAPARVKYLTRLDFIIEFDWTVWHGLTPLEKIALVDHELEHCSRDFDKDSEPLIVRDHDIEEFGSIVRRYGLWRRPVRAFAKDIQRALGQPDLFESAEGQGVEEPEPAGAPA